MKIKTQIYPEYWKNIFIKFALAKLNKRQKKILIEIYNNQNNGDTLTSLARKISKKLNLPESTVKWNLRLLRDVGLIEAGSINEKNIPVKLSMAGLLLAEVLKKMSD